jgi:hypothetical protein
VSENQPVSAVSRKRPRWWLELPLAVAYYAVYAKIRDWHGDATEHSRGIARAHGYSVLKVEKWLHIDIEHGVQHLALKSRDFVIGLDVYYGTFHFIFTCAVFVWQGRARPLPPQPHGARDRHVPRARRLRPLPDDAAAADAAGGQDGRHQ